MTTSKSAITQTQFAIGYLVPMGLTYAVTFIVPFLAFIPGSRTTLYVILYGLMTLVTYFRVRASNRLWVMALPISAFLAEIYLSSVILLPSVLMVVGLTVGLLTVGSGKESPNET